MLIPTNTSGLATLPVGATIFVDAVNGNDSAALRGRADKPFLTPTAAINVAQSGDRILLGPGIFNIGTAQLNIPNGVSLAGSGVANAATTVAGFSTTNNAGTIIQSSHTSVDPGGYYATVCPGNNSTISDLTIYCTAATPNDALPIGMNIQAGDKQSTNVTIRNVQTVAYSDGVYIRSLSSQWSGTSYWKLIGCNFVSQFDATNLVSSSSGFVWGLTLDYFNCQFNVAWDGATTNILFRGVAAGASASGWLVRLFGCQLTIVGGNNAGDVRAIDLGKGTVQLLGGTSINVSTVAGNLYAVNAASSGGVCQISPGCTVDASKINASAGKVTGIQSQVLGTGGTTVAAGAGSGSGATVSLAAGSDDSQGQISFTPGSGATSSSAQFAVTFGTGKLYSFPVLTPANAAAQALSGATLVGFSAASGSGFTVSSGTTALTAATTYIWNFRA